MAMISEKHTAPDVADVLKKIRERLASQVRAEIASGPATAAPAPEGISDSTAVLRQLLAATQSATSQIGALNPRRPGLVNSFIQWIKRMLRRLLTWYTRPITQAQALNSQLLTEATGLLERHDIQVRALEQQLREQAGELAELRAVLQSKLDWIILELEKQERERS